MEIQKQIIPIFFTIDDGYAPCLGAALNSLIQNASPAYDYKIFVIHQELSEDNRRKLAALAREHFEVQFVPMRKSLSTITDRMENRLRSDYFTLTIYFRLFIPVMFPEFDKGIYLDSDVVVPGDISEMFRIELGDNLLGAAQDRSVVDIPELAKYMQYAIGIDKYEYINSGVLLMNLKKMREVRLDEHFLRLLNQYHFECVAPDQDYLNAMCNGKIVYLPASWDAMPTEGVPPMEHPNLIHYNLFSKPWLYDGIQYEDDFWKYAADCGYAEELRRTKQNYSEESKKADEEHLALIIHRADLIADTDTTFRVRLAGGEKIRL